MSGDGRRIVRTDVYENGIRVSRINFEHDGHGNVTEIREFPDALGTAFISTGISYHRGAVPEMIVTFNVRDANNNLVGGNGTIVRTFTYDAMLRPISETDPNGYTTRWAYDGIGRVTRIYHPDGGLETFAYNDGRKTMTHRTVLGATYTHTFDGFGNLLSITTPDGRFILTNEYDNRMRLYRTWNATGQTTTNVTRFTYDIFDRVIERRIEAPNGAILQRTTTVYNDITNNVTEEALVTTTLHGGGNAPSIATFTRYDRFGRLIQHGTTGGRVTTYTLDLSGRITREVSTHVRNDFTHNFHGITSVRNILGDTSHNTFDHMGRLVTASDFMGNVQRFYYDNIGRLIRHRIPFERIGNITHYSETRYFYDANGNLVQTDTAINRPGQAQQWATNRYTFRHNRLISSLIGVGNGGIRTDYTYDHAGNILTKRVGGTGNPGAVAVGGVVTRFAYDNRGRLTSVTDPMGFVESFVYDLNGLISTRTDPNGIQFRYTRDNMGRVTQVEAVQNNRVIARRQYTYTMTGAIRIAANDHHWIEYFYDSQGRLVRQLEGESNRPPTTKKEFSYDNANNIVHSTVVVGGMTYLSDEYTRDAAGRVSVVRSRGDQIAHYTYDANGNVYVKIYGNNSIRVYHERNLAGLVTRLWNVNIPNISIFSIFDYTYLLDGNIYRALKSLGDNAHIMPDQRRITYFFYDSARRLVGETETIMKRTKGWFPHTTTREFLYDNRGNRQQSFVFDGQWLWSGGSTYTYDNNNRLTSIQNWGESALGSPLPALITFTYDRNGNLLTTQATGQILETRTYNPFNQLTHVTNPAEAATTSPNWTFAEYTYRADGLRHTKRWGNPHGNRSDAIIYTYLQGNIVIERLRSVADCTFNGLTGMFSLLERDPNGKLIRCGNITVNSNLTTFIHRGWFLHNARGDIIQRVCNNRTILQTYHYDAFGNQQNEINPIPDMQPPPFVDQPPMPTFRNYFRFAGEYHDFSTGEIYLRARMYNPRVGRFTQRDPHWGIHNMIFGDNPVMRNNRLMPDPWAISQAGNLFVYTMNNPVFFNDPTGRFVEPVTKTILLFILISGILGGGVDAGIQMATGTPANELDWSSIMISAGAGMASGAFGASGFGLGNMVIANAGIGAVSSTFHQINTSEGIALERILIDTGAGALAGMFGGAGLSHRPTHYGWHITNVTIPSGIKIQFPGQSQIMQMGRAEFNRALIMGGLSEAAASAFAEHFFSQISQDAQNAMKGPVRRPNTTKGPVQAP